MEKVGKVPNLPRTRINFFNVVYWRTYTIGNPVL